MGYSDLRENLLAWLDDFALSDCTEDGLLRILRRTFELSLKHNLTIILSKSTLFPKEIQWWGRKTDASEVIMDPSNYQQIHDAEETRTAGELCQYVHCIAWMRSAIPRYSERVAPLYTLLEAVYKKVGKRTKRKIENMNSYDLGWENFYSIAIAGIQEQLENVVKSAHCDPWLRICIHRDANNAHWAAAVTQWDVSELRKRISKQNYQPLPLPSASFSSVQEHWSTYEKEALAVVEKFRCSNCMLACTEDI